MPWLRCAWNGVMHSLCRAYLVGASLLLFLSPAMALEVQPWFGDVYEFHLLFGYSYYRFSSVDSSTTPLPKPSNNNLLFADLEFSFSPKWSIDADVEWAGSTYAAFGFRSTALQLRYLIWDDMIGDTVSLSTGGNIRYVSSRDLHDVGCPYAAPINVEANLSVGKEWDAFYPWRFRLWGFSALGMANQGSPWVRGILAVEGNDRDIHKAAFLIEGFHGYGSKTVVDIDHFHGYGRIRAKFIDCAIRYGHRIGVWGTLRGEYRVRLAASRCPKNLQLFAVSFLLPFSF